MRPELSARSVSASRRKVASAKGHFAPLTYAQPQRPGQREVAKDSGVAPDHARHEPAPDVHDARSGSDDRSLDLNTMYPSVGADGGVGTDVRVSDLRSRANDRRSDDHACPD